MAENSQVAQRQGKAGGIASAGKFLGVFTLAMINVSLICSLRGLPTMANYGLSLIFFLVVAVVFFLLPTAFVSAELASTFPDRGGIYHWVKMAYGEKWGFAAICLQWLQNLFFYTTALTALAAVLAYLFNPGLANNPLYTITVIIVVYWGAILINLKGMKVSGTLATYGTILGVILPGVVLIVLAIAWLIMREPIAIPITWGALIPNLSSINEVVFLTGIFLCFAGIEVSGVHAREVKDPQKDYPKAIYIASVIIVLIFLLGSLAIALIIPQSEISLTAGIMQTYMAVLQKFNLMWLLPIIVILCAPGMIVQVSSWIAGPSRGLLVTARNGDLPPVFQKMNKHQMPVNIMIFQACVVTLLSALYLFFPSVSGGFWYLTAIAAIMYLFVYILLFLTGVKLRKLYPDTVRPYSVPGGKRGMLLFSAIGIFACVAGIVLGLIPPSQEFTGDTTGYAFTMSLLLLIFFAIPFIIFYFRKPSWKKDIPLE